MKNESCNVVKTILLDVITLDTLFKEFYEELKDKSRIIYYKGNQNGFNDNIYTSDDLLHDFYFSIKKTIEKGNLSLESKDHFIAISYLRMKSIYYNYLKKKWARNITEKDYFTDLGYTNDASDIIRRLFSNKNEGVLKEEVTEQDILNIINDFDNEEQKRILTLKTKHVTNEKLGNYLKYTNDELRSKIYYSRKKLFKKMKEKEYINNNIIYNDIIGRDNNKATSFNLLNDKKNYYNDYPFELSYKKKILFIVSKNKNKISVDKLKIILKINEGKSMRQDSKSCVNKYIRENIIEKKCFLMDDILYLTS